jgi:hypothetical protein
MRRWILATAFAGMVWTVAFGSANPIDTSVPAAGPWVLTNSTTVAAAMGNQGLTTVTGAGRAVTINRGFGSIAPDLAAQAGTISAIPVPSADPSWTRPSCSGLSQAAHGRSTAAVTTMRRTTRQGDSS